MNPEITEFSNVDGIKESVPAKCDDTVEEILFDFLPPIGNFNENLSDASERNIKFEIDEIFGKSDYDATATISGNTNYNQFNTDIIDLDDGLNIDEELNKINLNLNDVDFREFNLQPPKITPKNRTAPNSPSHDNGTKSTNRIYSDYNHLKFEDRKSKSSLKDQYKPKSSTDIFGDILDEQGYKFESKLNNGSKTINELRKSELLRDMDPNKLKIYNWTDGKRNNIRALLCSLHTILWQNSKWTKCEMHQLITPSDVKKAYRRGCLACHPDKQIGTNNENIAKMIFMELNNAWSEFEKDETQQKIFS